MEKNYVLEINERQAKLLSYVCDRFSRMICGQDMAYQELFEEAWEKRCKEKTGEMMNKDFEGGWYKMRRDAEELSRQIKKRFWNCEVNELYGVHYDDDADILFDIHQVIRHQLWLDKEDSKKTDFTVDANEAMRFGSEPLVKISLKQE